MIVDLNQPLYVIDERAKYHKIKTFDILERKVFCEDGYEAEYTTTNITVVLGTDIEVD